MADVRAAVRRPDRLHRSAIAADAWAPAGVTGIAQNRFAMAKSARAVPSMLDLVGLTGVGPVSATCEAPGRSSAPSRNGRCEGRRPLRAH